MKCILNFSFEPYFVALFDASDNLVNAATWDEPKKGSQHVWDFLKVHGIGETQDLTFIGGVAGPGGFSSLRACGAILNALGYKFKLPVHQVRADKIARVVTGNQPFLLNSFSDSVFIPLGADNIERVALSTAETLLKDQPVFIDWLPKKKRLHFTPLKLEADFVSITLAVLQTQTPVAKFLPDYEYPPVQH